MKRLQQELSDVDKAKDLAMDIHSGQVRKGSGLPYYTHPFRVYQETLKFNLPKIYQVIALLHDVYEDGKDKVRIADIIKRKFGTDVLKNVMMLSHGEGIDYNTYLLKLSDNVVAFTVKLLDMLNNLYDRPTPKQLNKYKGAIEHLEQNGVTIPIKIKQRMEKVWN